jgi:glycosyltransferase involved in cell wall biosynthesis
MPHEHNAFRHRPPTAVVYQSKYQQQWMSLQYSAWGVPDDRQRLIHGAFDAESFPFQPRPHIPGEPFVVGTIGRAVGAKWPKRLASILAAARERTPVDGNWLGWHPSVERYSGQVPPWVRTRLPGAVPIAEFLSECHALLVVPDCPENWSRVVLEALACGVPVIASNDGGIPEQIRHEENGLLASYEDEATAAVVRLATDEPFRLMIAENGRKSLSCLANREATGSAWRSLFASLQNS